MDEKELLDKVCNKIRTMFDEEFKKAMQDIKQDDLYGILINANLKITPVKKVEALRLKEG